MTPDRTADHTGNLYIFTVLEATYTDKGNGAAPALTGVATGEYHPHTQATNVYPLGEGTGLYTGQTFMQGPGHWFKFDNYELSKIGAITMSISSRGSGGTMEVRAGSPTGPLVASAVMPDTKPPASLQRIYQVLTAPIVHKPQGAVDLYFVTKWTDPAQHPPTEPFPEIFINTYTLVEYPEVSAALDPPTGNASNGWYTTPVTFTMTSTGFSAATRQYRLDGGAWTDYTDPVTISAAGPAHDRLPRDQRRRAPPRSAAWSSPSARSPTRPGTVGGTGAARRCRSRSARRRASARSRPGVARTYMASTTATVTSSAGDATLSVAVRARPPPGVLTNGAFALASLQAGVGSVRAGRRFGPTALKSWPRRRPTTPSPSASSSAIGANDALRTGTYSKTLTFTLSTTQP